MNWLKDLVASRLLPPILKLLNEQFDKWMPEVVNALRAKFDEFVPVLVQAVVTAVARAAGQLTVNTADRVTDIIPGDLDDRIIDPIVRDVMSQLEPIFGNLFGGSGR